MEQLFIWRVYKVGVWSSVTKPLGAYKTCVGRAYKASVWSSVTIPFGAYKTCLGSSCCYLRVHKTLFKIASNNGSFLYIVNMIMTLDS